jgi:hypothetical protein
MQLHNDLVLRKVGKYYNNYHVISISPTPYNWIWDNILSSTNGISLEFPINISLIMTIQNYNFKLTIQYKVFIILVKLLFIKTW